MLVGFKNRTKELTDEEKRIANHILSFFKLMPKFRTNRQVREELKRVYNIKVRPERYRKMLHYIRVDLTTSEEFIIASNQGYKFTVDLEEMEKYQKSMDGRINSQLEIYNEVTRRIRWKRHRQKTGASSVYHSIYNPS